MSKEWKALLLTTPIKSCPVQEIPSFPPFPYINQIQIIKHEQIP